MLKAFEDMNYEAVDNVPLSLLSSLVMSAQPAFQGAGFDRPLAVGVDIRTRDFGVDAFLSHYDELTQSSTLDVQILFVDCDDEELRRRYEVTRHRHPVTKTRRAVERPSSELSDILSAFGRKECRLIERFSITQC